MKSTERPADVRVLIVDDHPITRRGLRALLEAQRGFTVCGEADAVMPALALAQEAAPDVVIVDIGLQSADGLKLVSELKAATPSAPVIVLSMHEESVYADRARRAGADGYVMKQHASDRIVAAILSVLAGQQCFASAAAPQFEVRSLTKRSLPPGVAQLSARETEVLRCIGNGFSTREVAAQLGLSPKTIDTYRDHLKAKLEIGTGEDLVRFAIQWANGLARSENASGR